MLFSFYAEAVRCYEDIITSENDAFVHYFFEKEYVMGNYTWTLELAYASVDRMTTATLNERQASLSTSDNKMVYVTAWELFRNYEIFDIIADMSDLLYFAFVTNVDLEESYVTGITNDLWALTTFQRSLVAYLSIDGPYYDALTNYYEEIADLTEDGKEIADKLLHVEVASLDLDKQENKDKFNTLMAQITAVYDDLEESDKTILNAMYEKYLAIYNENNDNENTENGESNE
jgi:hypothetical protein